MSRPSTTSTTTHPTTSAVRWLLGSAEPGIRVQARRDLLGQAVTAADRAEVLDGDLVRRLLAGQQADGGFGGHPYAKWTGAHWRLVSLVELAVPPGEPRAVAMAGRVLGWLMSTAHRAGIRTVDGLTRRCASQEGNALAAACRLGLATDDRVQELARELVEWQWPDGGWNCDVRASGRRSSFHETLPPAWGLHEYATATGDRAARDAARRAAELLLEHHLFRSTTTGDPIHPSWLVLHYPPYWHYDVLQALVVLDRMGLARDPRAADALDHLERRRLRDGRWRPGAYWWRRPGTSGGTREVVDWGRGGPNEMITLNALRVLRGGGRLP
ncbi:MAG TPA: hypothetical protein VK908_05760 [Jiangellales bacterium]|nr:hypothetical protein [Jiangellales bacterium]